MMLIRRGTDAWYAKLNAADAALMGCEWLPLPLTSAATDEQALQFAAATPMGRDGVTLAESL